MAQQIWWQSILSSGARVLDDSHRNSFVDFALPVPPVAAASALLILAAKNIGAEKNFLTLNMSPSQAVEFDDMSHAFAKDKSFFVNEFFSTGSKYTVQIHMVKPGQLKSGANNLGIHARDNNGNAIIGNIENFEVARIFLIYTTSA
jgi:hypothetical protein